MTELLEIAWHAAGLLAQAPQPALNPWAPYVGGGSISALLGFLYWSERQERKEAQDRERATYKESMSEIVSVTGTLREAIDVFKELRQTKR